MSKKKITFKALKTVALNLFFLRTPLHLKIEDP